MIPASRWNLATMSKAERRTLHIFHRSLATFGHDIETVTATGRIARLWKAIAMKLALAVFALAMTGAPDLAHAGQVDDLEEYRSCLNYFYAGPGTAVETVTACQWPLEKWMEAPTFDAEWRVLMTDPYIARIVEEAEAGAPRDYRGEFQTCAHGLALDMSKAKAMACMRVADEWMKAAPDTFTADMQALMMADPLVAGIVRGLGQSLADRAG